MLTAEQLLQPRVELIAWYPRCSALVGAIFRLIPNSDWYDKFDGGCILAESVDRATANFRKLNWHEKREIEDMPEYVRTNAESIRLSRKEGFDHEVCYKVIRWEIYPGDVEGIGGQMYALVRCKGKDVSMNVSHFEPATQAEYEHHSSE